MAQCPLHYSCSTVQLALYLQVDRDVFIRRMVSFYFQTVFSFPSRIFEGSHIFEGFNIGRTHNYRVNSPFIANQPKCTIFVVKKVTKHRKSENAL